MTDCPPPNTLWEPDDAPKVEFRHNATSAVYYTIPNRAVRFVGLADSQMRVGVLEGANIDTVHDYVGSQPATAVVPQPRVEVKRLVDLHLQMNFYVDTGGALWASTAEGWYRNWAALNELAEYTIGNGLPDAATEAGVQRVDWTPYDGASPIILPEVHVMPPVPGNITPGYGMELTLPLELVESTALP